MNDSNNALNELQNIRKMMERSSRFLSLSGWSGIVIGIYALLGAYITQHLLNNNTFGFGFENQIGLKAAITIVAAMVLLLSLFTIFLLTLKKARKDNKPIWGPGSRMLLFSLLIPLLTGGVLSLIFIQKELFNLLYSVFLIFYGLALVNAAKYTRPEILGLGILEILSGLIAAAFPQAGLYLWAFGFGLAHIIYGLVFLKSDHKISRS